MAENNWLLNDSAPVSLAQEFVTAAADKAWGWFGLPAAGEGSEFEAPGSEWAATYWTPAEIAFNGPEAGGPTAYTLDAQPASFTVTVQANSMRATRYLNVQPTAYALTAFAASLLRGYRLNAQPTAYALTVAAAGLLAARRINAQPAGYTVTAAPAGATAQRRLIASPASYALTVAGAQLRADHRLLASPATIIVTASDATLTAGGAPSTPNGSYLVRMRHRGRR